MLLSMSDTVSKPTVTSCWECGPFKPALQQILHPSSKALLSNMQAATEITTHTIQCPKHNCALPELPCECITSLQPKVTSSKQQNASNINPCAGHMSAETLGSVVSAVLVIQYEIAVKVLHHVHAIRSSVPECLGCCWYMTKHAAKHQVHSRSGPLL